MIDLSPEMIAQAISNPEAFAASLLTSGLSSTSGVTQATSQFAGLATPQIPTTTGAEESVSSTTSSRLTPEERASRREQKRAEQEAAREAKKAELEAEREARRQARQERLEAGEQFDPRSAETLSDGKLRGLSQAVERIAGKEAHAIEGIDRRLQSNADRVSRIEANNPDYVAQRNEVEQSRQLLEQLKKIENPSPELQGFLTNFETSINDKEARLAASPVGKKLAALDAEKEELTKKREKFQTALDGSNAVLEELKKELDERKGISAIPQLEKNLKSAQDHELAATNKANEIKTTIDTITKNNEALEAAVKAIDDPALKDRLNKIISDNNAELKRQQAFKEVADKAVESAKTEREAAEKALEDSKNGRSGGATHKISIINDKDVGKRAVLIEIDVLIPPNSTSA